MKERPIPFSGPMVRAILAGEKTQTRRLVKPQPSEHHWRRIPDYELSCKVVHGQETFARFRHHLPNQNYLTEEIETVKSRYGKPGDQLWVRETWQTHCDKDGIAPRDLPPDTDVQYPATYDGWVSRRRAGIHMPRWASRITLEITGIRVERLQDISEADAMAEGISIAGHKYASAYRSPKHTDGKHRFGWSAYEMFHDLWNDINGPESWDANPWVWVLGFEVEKAPDAYAQLTSAQRDERALPAVTRA